MSVSEQPDYNVKRIVLPSGKAIEVAYFSEGAPAPSPGIDPEAGLHVCRECASPLVYPTSWEEAGADHWHVEIRCPNCDWTADGVFSQEVVEFFDEELDRGMDILMEDLKRLARANMADEIDRFVAALEADALLPSDF